MSEIAVIVGVVFALVLGYFLLRALVAGAVVRILLSAVGADALALAPDRIHLTRLEAEPWTDPAALGQLAAPLERAGFEDAGIFAVDEMPGLHVRLLAHRRESLYAALYEHPQAGRWADLVARYEDGEEVTFTTSQPTGLDERPGHRSVYAPGSSTDALLARARTELPRRPLVMVRPDEAPAVFEESYAESTAWRKGKGISAREVGEVAKRAAA
jgi:hypothetical protein